MPESMNARRGKALKRSRPHFAGFLLCTALLTIPGTCGGRTLDEYDVARLRSVVETRISPDGQFVAYVLAVPRTPFKDVDGPAYRELHLADASGKSRPYVTGEVDVAGIEWTPDGRGISFLTKRNRDKHTALYVIPLDGGESQKRLEHGADIAGYAWDPRGGQVAFLAAEPEPKDLKELRDKGFDQKIFEENLRFVRLWIASSAPRAEDKPRLLPLEGSASAVRWCPVSNRLAVALAPTPLVDDTYMRRIVHVVDSRDGTVLARLEHPAKLGQFEWSPDGRHLATISGEDIHDPSEGRLLLWSADGSRIRELLPDYAAHVRGIAWTDNQTVAYVAEEGVGTRVGKIKIDASNPQTLIPPDGPILSRIHWAVADGALAFVGSTPEHPEEVFVHRPGAGLQRLTASNPWLSECRRAPQEILRWRARDGLELEGILIRPLEIETGQRCPLIVVVHGGPEASVPNGWVTSYSRPGQLGAGRGFAVFYPNYRSGTGRGVAFSKLGFADAGGPEFDDIVDGVDHLVAIGLADRERVGITGGSYGGYAAAWGATYYSDRYAAAVMAVGLTDLISKTGTTDIPWEMYFVHHGKWVWDDWDYYLKRSPIYYAARCRTPLLILHGEKDTRVHPSQSLELHRHLKVLNQAPVRLVLYPGEGHGNRHAAARLDYSLRLMRWMTHYLQGPGGEPPPYDLDYRRPPTGDDHAEGK